VALFIFGRIALFSALFGKEIELYVAKKLLEIGYGLELVTFIRNCFWSSCLSFTWWQPVFRTALSRECSSLVPWKLYCQRQHGTWRVFGWNAGLYTAVLTYCRVRYIWRYDSSM